MSDDFLARIWGSKETAYSSVVAQTLILSQPFREFMEQQLEMEKGDLSISSIETEKDLSGSGRIDVYFECKSGWVVGIENKKWAQLQPKQLYRYTESLGKNNKYRLVLLSPSRYNLPEEEKPDGLIVLTYKKIMDWIKELGTNEEFQNTYYRNLSSYLEELEMQPMRAEEIESLLFFAPGEKKLRVVLDELRKVDERIETSCGNYILFGRRESGFLFFAGFRFGTNWYYNDGLLGGRPECIVYLKDVWTDSEQQEKNATITMVHDKLTQEKGLCEQQVQVDMYPRTGKNKCRLAIRRPLDHFKDKDLSEIISWFRSVISDLEGSLAVGVHSQEEFSGD